MKNTNWAKKLENLSKIESKTEDDYKIIIKYQFLLSRKKYEAEILI